MDANVFTSICKPNGTAHEPRCKSSIQDAETLMCWPVLQEFRAWLLSE